MYVSLRYQNKQVDFVASFFAPKGAPAASRDPSLCCALLKQIAAQKIQLFTPASQHQIRETPGHVFCCFKGILSPTCCLVILWHCPVKQTKHISSNIFPAILFNGSSLFGWDAPKKLGTLFQQKIKEPKKMGASQKPSPRKTHKNMPRDEVSRYFERDVCQMKASSPES